MNQQREFCQPCDEELMYELESLNTENEFKIEDLPANMSMQQIVNPDSEFILRTIKEVMSNMEQTYAQPNIECTSFQEYLYKQGKKRLVQKLGIDEKKCIKLIQMEINYQIHKQKQLQPNKNRIKLGKNNVFIPAHVNNKKKVVRLYWV